MENYLDLRTDPRKLVAGAKTVTFCLIILPKTKGR